MLLIRWGATASPSRVKKESRIPKHGKSGGPPPDALAEIELLGDGVGDAGAGAATMGVWMPSLVVRWRYKQLRRTLAVSLEYSNSGLKDLMWCWDPKLGLQWGGKIDLQSPSS